MSELEQGTRTLESEREAQPDVGQDEEERPAEVVRRAVQDAFSTVIQQIETRQRRLEALEEEKAEEDQRRKRDQEEADREYDLQVERLQEEIDELRSSLKESVEEINREYGLTKAGSKPNKKKAATTKAKAPAQKPQAQPQNGGRKDGPSNKSLILKYLHMVEGEAPQSEIKEYIENQTGRSSNIGVELGRMVNKGFVRRTDQRGHYELTRDGKKEAEKLGSK